MISYQDPPPRSVGFLHSGTHLMPSVDSEIPKDEWFNGRLPARSSAGAPETSPAFSAAPPCLASNMFVFYPWRLQIYSRYWTGWVAWSEVFRTSRIFSRLIWLRVPPTMESGPVGSRDQEAVGIVMVERVLTLDLPWHRYFFGKFPTLNSFAVALKHHLRYNSRPNHLL